MRKSENSLKKIFLQDTVTLAKSLLGKLIVTKDEKNNIFAGYIVETEAYLGVEDMACHSYGGKRTPKVEALYQEAGTIYIYTMHTHKMLNIVSCGKDNPQAVLIRAIEPLINIKIMEENRGKTGILVTNGPGKLTKAMNINDKFNMGKVKEIFHMEEIKGLKLQDKVIYIDFEKSRIPKKIDISNRIGIPNKGIWTHQKLRFYVKGNRFVSGMKKRDFVDESWI